MAKTIYDAKVHLKDSIVKHIEHELKMKDKKWSDVVDIILDNFSCITIKGKDFTLFQEPENLGKVTFDQDGHHQNELCWRFKTIERKKS